MITRIQIKNFRSIEKISFDFMNEEKNIICLLGKNGAGKSNIFKAICYFFRYMNKSYSDEDVIDKNNPYIQKCVISIVFDIDLLSKKAAYNEQLNEKFDIIRKYIDQKTNNFTTSPATIELTLTQFRDGMIKWNINNKKIIETIKSVFPLYYIDTRRLDLYTWDKMWQIISDLSASKPNDNYKEVLDEAFYEIYGDKYKYSKDNIEQAFDKYGISLDKYHFDDRYKNAFSMRFGGNQFVVDGHSLEYYSDGTSSFSYLRLLITLIPKISDISCKYPIMLIDEPEIGLHNELITEFVNCLVGNVKRNAFCMMSTHSPKMIADLSNQKANYSIYKINKKGLFSVINKMNNSWIEKSKHRVTVRETECFFSDYLVYVEGETEIQLFNHPKIIELFNDLKKVHFYSFDSNDERLKTVHSEYLNLGIPYKIIIDMDKVLQYNKKNKFSIRPEHTVNPLSIKHNAIAEKYRYYNKNSKDLVSKRQKINRLLKKNYSLATNKNYIDDSEYNSLMYEIIDFCNFYNVIVNWSTIEGCLITYENITDFIDFVNASKTKHTKQHVSFCSESDIKEKTILILSEYNGKSELFTTAQFNGNSVNHALDKTEGWVFDWLNYYFKVKIDMLPSIEHKKSQFKNDFPQLFNTLQIIEKMI